MPSGNCSFMVSSLSSCLGHLLPCDWFTLVFALATCASLHPLMIIEHRLLHPHLIFIYLTSTMTVFPKAILSSGGHRLRLSGGHSLTQCTEYVLVILHSFTPPSWIFHHANPTYPSTIPSFVPDSLMYLYITQCAFLFWPFWGLLNMRW